MKTLALNMDLNSRTKYWIPVLLYAGFIFYLSSIPYAGIAVQMNLSLIHIPEFFILSYLIFRAISREKTDIRHAIILAIVVSSFYGVTDEIHQIFVPGRAFSVFDIIFNFIGSSLILFKFWKR